MPSTYAWVPPIELPGSQRRATRGPQLARGPYHGPLRELATRSTMGLGSETALRAVQPSSITGGSAFRLSRCPAARASMARRCRTRISW
jgi:hypothetical protein